jgi:hypothetical protein
MRVVTVKGDICQKCVKFIKENKKSILIKKISDKRKKENSEYLNIRAKYLKENPYCQVYGCNRKSSDIHHKKGRENSLLNDLTYFLGVCRCCHSKIELNPIWAKENGYSLNRTSND